MEKSIETTDSLNIDEFSTVMFKSVMDLIRVSGQLPKFGDDFDYLTSFEQFQQMTENYGLRILEIIQMIMNQHSIKGNLAPSTNKNKLLDIEDLCDVLLDANDQLIERIGIHLDDAAGNDKASSLVIVAKSQLTNQNSADVNISNSNNNTSGSSFKSAGQRSQSNFSLLTAKNISRPQQFFKDKVDNSPRPFVPKITEKPHGLKSIEESLGTSLPLDPNKELDASFSYPHPYQYELDNFEPREQFLIVPEPRMPADIASTPLTIVTSLDQLQSMLDQLKVVNEIAIDLEHHSFRSYQGFTCLMQISTRQQDYIVDTILLRHHLQILNRAFTDPNIVKVLHGSDSDVLWLQKDFGLYLVNTFDTGQASRVLGHRFHSLAHLLDIYCGVMADKQYQLADWRIRPLPEQLLKYAQEDTHYLLYIYDRVRKDLLDKVNGQPNLLIGVFNASNIICKKKYEKPQVTESSFREIYYYSQYKDGGRNKNLGHRQMETLKNLYAWRNKLARQEDESVGYILPNHMLLQIAEVLPKEQEGILSCCKPIPPFVKKQLREIHAIVEDARAQTIFKVQTSKLPVMKPTRLQNPIYYQLLNQRHDKKFDSPYMGRDDPIIINGESEIVFENRRMYTLKNKCDCFLVHPNETSAVSMNKLVDSLKNSFSNPFLGYLPNSITSKMSSTDQPFEKWKLLKNTVPVLPVVKKTKTPQVLETSSMLSFDNASPQLIPIRNQLHAEQTSNDLSTIITTTGNAIENSLEIPFSGISKKKKKRKNPSNDCCVTMASGVAGTDSNSKSTMENNWKKNKFLDVKPHEYKQEDMERIFKGDNNNIKGFKKPDGNVFDSGNNLNSPSSLVTATNVNNDNKDSSNSDKKTKNNRVAFNKRGGVSGNSHSLMFKDNRSTTNRNKVGNDDSSATNRIKGKFESSVVIDNNRTGGVQKRKHFDPLCSSTPGDYDFNFDGKKGNKVYRGSGQNKSMTFKNKTDNMAGSSGKLDGSVPRISWN